MVIVSGLERSTFEVLRVLHERGAAVHCIVNSWENQRIVHLAEDIGATWSTTYHWYSFDRHTRNPLKLAQFGWDILRTSLGVVRDAQRFHATHVLMPDFLSVIRAAPALALLRARGVAVVLRVGNAPVPSPFYGWLWRRAVNPFVDRIVCNSHSVQQQLAARGVPAAKVCTIYNTLPTDSSAAPNGRPRDCHKVIYVGQLIPEKGADLVLDAVGLLAARGQQIRLDIVGALDGWVPPAYAGYRERLLTRARAPDLAGRVRFLGWRDDVPALFAEAGVHCCPSRPAMLEGCPLVALEAKAAGIPSVAFPIGPFPELIEHEKDGWICSDVTAGALAEGLEYFLADADRQVRAGQAAHTSLQRFDRRRFVDEWWRLVTAT